MSTSRLRLGRMSSRVAVAGAVGAIAVGVVACGSDSGSDSSSSSSGSSGGGGGDKVVVGLITKTESNPFFVKMKEAAQKAADANNAKLVTAAGKQDTDDQSQVTAIENMTTRGAKGILITPADSKAIVPSIKKARDAGVTVIALDTPTEPQDAADALFATDNMKAGELIGAWAKAKFAKDKKQARSSRSTSPPGSRSACCATTASSRASARPTRSARPRRRDRRPVQGAGGDGEPAPEGAGRQPRLHDQ